MQCVRQDCGVAPRGYRLVIGERGTGKQLPRAAFTIYQEQRAPFLAIIAPYSRRRSITNGRHAERGQWRGCSKKASWRAGGGSCCLMDYRDARAGR